MTEKVWFWIGLNGFFLMMLLLDLFVFHRRRHTIQVREALLWTGFWVVLSLLFCVGIYFFYHGDGRYSQEELVQQYLTGYLIEKALSVDNLFVFLSLFTFFNTPKELQHKVLFWGILGAIVFRVIFIVAGLALIRHFDWMLYILGGILIFTALRMLFSKRKMANQESNVAIRFVKRLMPVTEKYEGGRFFVRINGVLHATPLFITLLAIETTDLIFAVDSIPAIIAISDDTFIVYSSNIFAVLGLRSLYFALAGFMDLFHFLHIGLSLVLFFIGAKIILHQAHLFEIPTLWALVVTIGLLVVSVLLSIIFPKKKKNKSGDTST